MDWAFYLPVIWAGIIGFGVMMYVVMDGFDLGVGMLFPFFRKKEDRDVMMNSVAPIWDGNETWMVLGGAGLFGAFPLAYSVILSALYLPLMFMLTALIFRGVAFEFRFKSQRTRPLWDIAFAGGSFVAALMQGIALGALIDGIPVVDRNYAGGTFDWLTPFTVFVGLGVVAGYLLLGASWIVMKTEGILQADCWRLVLPLTAALLLIIGGVSVWTPLAHQEVADRWFAFPDILFFLPVPILVLLVAFLMLRAVTFQKERWPFLLALSIFFLGYSGLAISMWPHLIPPAITIWDAASPPSSQGFLLVGVAVLVPVILAYTGYSYWVFRGKVRHGEGYHH